MGSMNESIVDMLMTSTSLEIDGGRSALKSIAVMDFIPGAAKCLLAIAVYSSARLVLTPA